MSNATLNGEEPANAIIIDNGENVCYGLTKREDAAIKIMAAMLSNPTTEGEVQDIVDSLPRIAVIMADELLKELSK